MGRGKALTAYEKGQIDAYHASGRSNREIAKLLSRSLNVINNYVKDPNSYGTAKSPGRPWKVKPRLIREITCWMSNKSVSLRKAGNMLSKKVSKDTVHRVVKNSVNLAHVKLNRSPAFNDHHRLARRGLAVKNMTTNLEQCKSVFWPQVLSSFIVVDNIFNEKKFNLDGPDGYAYIGTIFALRNCFLNAKVLEAVMS